MQKLRSDLLIKRLRQEKGLTQGQLCRGICNVSTLSKIERGEHMPTFWIFKQLMQRLGENPGKYWSGIVTMEDKEIVDLRDEIERLLWINSAESNNKAEEMMRNFTLKLKGGHSSFTEKGNLQFLLSNRAFLAFNRGEYAAMLDFALEGIKVTLPDFDEDLVDTYHLTFDEICLVNQIATAYLSQEKLEKSLGVYLRLKKSMDNGYFCYREKMKSYILVLLNLSCNLGALGKYHESLSIEDEAIKLCKQYHQFYFLPQLLSNKACSLYYLDKKEEAQIYLKRAYYLTIGFGNDASYEEDLAKRFGFELISPLTS